MSRSFCRLRLCLPGLFCLPVFAFGVGQSEAVRADLSLSNATAPSAFELNVGGERAARALAHYSLALEAEDDGRLREALAHYESALAEDPGNPDLAMHSAELAYSFQGRKKALEILQKAVTDSPEKPAAYLNLARFCATYAPDDPFENDRAQQTLEQALQKFPRNAQVYGFAALTFLTKGERAKAEELMAAATRQEVKEVAFWLELGLAAQKVLPLGQQELREAHVGKVNVYYAKALKLLPASSKEAEKVQLEVAQFYLLSNQLELARDLCEKMVAQSGHMAARKLLYRLYDSFGQKDKALQQLEAIVKQDPADVEQHRLLANTYESREEFAKAVPHLEAAIQLGGGEGEDYLYLGEVMLRALQPEKVVQLAQRCARLFPDQPMFHVQAALAYRMQQKWDLAVRAFAKADELASGSPGELTNYRFYFQYAVTLERSGQFDEAGRIFEKSITLTPKDDREEAANTMNYLGYMWLELGRHLDKAGELITKANELVPDNAAFVDSLGWWHFKQGRLEDAERELQRAIGLLPALQPEDAEIIEHLGQVYLKMNRPAKAREQFEKARDLGPKDSKVNARIEEGLRLSTPQ